MEGAIKALAHPSKAVQRLLKMAAQWSEQLSTATTLPAPPSPRTAYQLASVEIDSLVERYRVGATVRQLGTEFGIHHATVGRHLEARGVDTRELLLSTEAIRQASELYQAGATLEDLATQYQVGTTTIRRHLLLRGVTLRPRGRSTAS